jgi:putative hydrolase of the HAD superfamily
VLFIDDLPENVAAARALGIRAHLHADDAATLAVIREAVPDSGHPRAGAVASGA